MAAYNFRIEYTPGKNNERADILSRREQDLQDLKAAQIDNRSQVVLGPNRLHDRINSDLAATYVQVNSVQILAVSPVMKLDSQKLVESLLQENRQSFDKERRNPSAHYWIDNGLLLYRDRLCIP